MTFWKSLLIIVIGPALSGCASSMSHLGQSTLAQDTPPEEVPVASVVNAVKCEVNDFFYDQQKTPQKRAFRLKIDKGTQAKIKLNLRVSRGGGLAFSQINVTGSPLQALVSASPNATPFSAGGSMNSTMGVELSILMDQTATRALDCSTRKIAKGGGLKLKDWLAKLMNQGQDQIISEGPATHLSEIVLSTDFEVGGSAGISPVIAIIPVLVPPTLSASASYANQLQITLKGDSDSPGPTSIGEWSARAEPASAHPKP